jgi:tellurite resistance protein TehA-like permease
MALWGFELWNFGTALLVSIAKVPQMRPSISVWAYTFPLAIFSISSLQLAPILFGVNYVYPSYLLYGISIAAAIGLFAAWVYSSIFTIVFLSRIYKRLKG